MEQFLNGPVLLTLLAVLVIVVPAVLATLVYLKQIRSQPRTEQFVPRSEMDWQMSALGGRLDALLMEQKSSSVLLIDLRIEVSRLQQVLRSNNINHSP